jgi:hypothetical protein
MHSTKSLGFSERYRIHRRTVILQLKMKISQITANYIVYKMHETVCKLFFVKYLNYLSMNMSRAIDKKDDLN